MTTEEFTDEAAKAKLEELGFTVLDREDLVTTGWRIVFRDEWNNWAVEEIHLHVPTGESATMTMLVYDNAIDAALGLVGLLVHDG
jgi:hypothetical protein